MGLSFSCPLASYIDLENRFQSVITKSIDFENNDDSKMPVRSISFDNKVLSPTISRSEGSRKMEIEGRVGLKTTENEIKGPLDKEIDLEMIGVKKLPVFNLRNPKHEAAIKLQKVYKSFRTRRKLADCAVLIEQSWWKLLDFAELKRSSISFFDIEKPETAVSRWSRARTRAAKVGKGLSKNSRAQKLALQHWLEAIDPRHRYGHNLHFYYVKWLDSQSKEPFFYWLDIGEGKEINFVDKCPRCKLQQQCIKYLGPMERKAYEVIVEDGRFYYKQSGELLDTREGPKDVKWIFVLSASMNLYVGQKKKGTFQHSSFLAGGATSAAGRIVVEDGLLKAVWPHSGHYRPTPENFQDFISFLRGNNVDISDVKMDPDEVEGEELSSKSSKVLLESMSSEETDSDEKITEAASSEEEEKADKSAEIELPSQTSPFHSCIHNLADLSIPDRNDLCLNVKSEDTSILDEDDEESRGVGIPKEAILKRINSHKGMNSYQLGKQLSCKWTSGAGPRIGCLRDYPPKLQFRCLEKSNLSPRSGICQLRTMSSLDNSLHNRLIAKKDLRKISYSGELPRTNFDGSQNSQLGKKSVDEIG